MFQHCTEAPDLRLLPPEERGAVARALAKDPAERFPCCKDFIAALQPRLQIPQPHSIFITGNRHC
jgi:hypothetical protein